MRHARVNETSPSLHAPIPACIPPSSHPFTHPGSRSHVWDEFSTYPVAPELSIRKSYFQRFFPVKCRFLSMQQMNAKDAFFKSNPDWARRHERLRRRCASTACHLGRKGMQLGYRRTGYEECDNNIHFHINTSRRFTYWVLIHSPPIIDYCILSIRCTPPPVISL